MIERERQKNTSKKLAGVAKIAASALFMAACNAEAVQPSALPDNSFKPAATETVNPGQSMEVFPTIDPDNPDLSAEITALKFWYGLFDQETMTQDDIRTLYLKTSILNKEEFDAEIRKIIDGQENSVPLKGTWQIGKIVKDTQNNKYVGFKYIANFEIKDVKTAIMNSVLPDSPAQSSEWDGFTQITYQERHQGNLIINKSSSDLDTVTAWVNNSEAIEDLPEFSDWTGGFSGRYDVNLSFVDNNWIVKKAYYSSDGLFLPSYFADIDKEIEHYSEGTQKIFVDSYK